jgi:predicted CXXCH cytochrome family protein
VVIAALFLALLADTGYTGSAGCARCHAAIAESYSKTGMARSFRAVQPGVQLPEFNRRAFLHQASRQKFTPVDDAGKYTVIREQFIGGFPPYKVPVDYVLGSGDHARSYVHGTTEGLIQFPVSWYARSGGYWQMSPGFDRPDHQGFTRELNDRCLFCHNGYPLQTKLADGIDCERCHGPGAQHSKDATRTSIVNPARLSPERAIEVCMQCHLETSSRDFKGAVLRPGRTPFSYRPGEPLGDFQIYFDHAPEAGRADKFEIVSSVYRLRQSRCFLSAPEKLGCTACHDVHRAATRAETVAATARVCASCHQSDGHATSGSCVDCHMPTRATEDVPHVDMTDHRISRTRSVTRPSQDDAVPYTGRVVVYYPPNAVATAKPQPEVPRQIDYTSRGQALLRQGNTAAAIAAFREAVNERPELVDIRVNLAAALIVQQNYQAAKQQLEEAIRIGPPTALRAAHNNLGILLDLLGDKAGAAREFALAKF